MSDRHVIIEDEALQAGFTQIPNQILRRPDIPPGAKLAYMVLLSYAWQKDHSYPSQDRLAEDMGVSERSVITYLKQLVDSGLITIRRRGLGLTNVYVIHRISGSANSSPLTGSAKSASLEVQKSAAPEVQNLPQKNTQVNKTQLTDDSNDSNELDVFVSGEDIEQISWIIRDISKELGDQAPVKSTTTRASRLYAASGLTLEEFLDHVQVARLRTKQYTAGIKTERVSINGAMPIKPKVGYFFGVLEDLVKRQTD